MNNKLRKVILKNIDKLLFSLEEQQPELRNLVFLFEFAKIFIYQLII